MESSQTCRYYAEKYPKEGDVVVGKIKSLTEMGAYVELPEYNNIEGLIVYSELTKKRTRNIQRFIKVGSLEALCVLRVDESKGYIDLSKKRTQYEEKVAAFEKYTKGKIAHNVMLSVAMKKGIELAELYQKFGWPAAREFGSLYKCFKEVSTTPGVLSSRLEKSASVTKDLLEAITSFVRQKFVVPKIKVRADVEVKCNRGDGVLVVKDTLVRTGKKFEDVDIVLISSPIFSLTTLDEDKDACILRLNDCLDEIRRVITGKRGDFNVVMVPTVFGQKQLFGEEAEGSDSSFTSDEEGSS